MKNYKFFSLDSFIISDELLHTDLSSRDVRSCHCQILEFELQTLRPLLAFYVVQP